MSGTTTIDRSQSAEIRLIQIARRELQLAEDSYRALVAQYGNGATSSKALSAQQRRRLLEHFQACGFKLRPSAGKTGAAWRREPQMRKLRAMWYVMAEAGHVSEPADGHACDAAIEAWALRQLAPHQRLDSLRFANAAQMSKLIEELKAWGLRVGAAIV